MQTNFDFLVQTDRFKDFAMQAAEAERSIAISPSTAAILSRQSLRTRSAMRVYVTMMR